MAALSSIAAWAALCWAAAASTLGAIALVKRLRGRRLALGLTTLPAPGRPVLLMRPCAGDEPSLERCLFSIAQARRSVEVHVVFGVSEADDSAVPVVERACRALEEGGIPACLEVHPPRGPNRKAAILAGISEARLSDYDIAINADSNVDLSGYDVDALVAPLRRDDEVGAVWAPPIEEGVEKNLGNRSSLAVLGGSLHAFGLLSGIDPQGMVGKLFAIRCQDLHDVGGFADFTDLLGEDAELSRRLQARGLVVLPLPWPILSYGQRPRFVDTVARQARWMAVIRAQRLPLLFTYPFFFCGTPLILGLAALGFSAAPAVAVAAALTAVLGRLFVALAAQALSARRMSLGAGLLDAALADVALLAAFGRALFSTRVVWRGHRLRITRGGRLVAEPELPS